MTIGGRTRAISPVGKQWVNGSTIRIRFLSGTAAQQDAGARRSPPSGPSTRTSNFEFGDDPRAEIRVSFDADDGAWSYVGTDNSRIPLHAATLNLGWQDQGVILHEFGHMIGLAHEHQNPEGGLVWNEEEVIRDLSGPAELLGRGHDPAQRARQVQRRPGRRHRFDRHRSCSTPSRTTGPPTPAPPARTRSLSDLTTGSSSPGRRCTPAAADREPSVQTLEVVRGVQTGDRRGGGGGRLHLHRRGARAARHRDGRLNRHGDGAVRPEQPEPEDRRGQDDGGESRNARSRRTSAPASISLRCGTTIPRRAARYRILVTAS